MNPCGQTRVSHCVYYSPISTSRCRLNWLTYGGHMPNERESNSYK